MRAILANVFFNNTDKNLSWILHFITWLIAQIIFLALTLQHNIAIIFLSLGNK